MKIKTPKIVKKHPIAFILAVTLHVALFTLFINFDYHDKLNIVDKVQQNTSKPQITKARTIDVEIIEKAKQLAIANQIKKINRIKQEQRQLAKIKSEKKLVQQEIRNLAKKTKLDDNRLKKTQIKIKQEQLKKKKLEQQNKKNKDKLNRVKKKQKQAQAKTKNLLVQQKQAQAKTKNLLVQQQKAQAKTKNLLVQQQKAHKLIIDSKDKIKQAELASKKAKASILEANKQKQQAELTIKKISKNRQKAEKILKIELQKLAKIKKQKDKTNKDKKLLEEAANQAKLALALAKKQELLAINKSIKAEQKLEKSKLERKKIDKDKQQKQQELEAQQKKLDKRDIAIKDQLKELKLNWQQQIMAKVKKNWRYGETPSNWSCKMVILQNTSGSVKSIKLNDCKVSDNKKLQSFKNSIERAVKRASPLPIAPDESIFDEKILFHFMSDR